MEKDELFRYFGFNKFIPTGAYCMEHKVLVVIYPKGLPKGTDPLKKAKVQNSTKKLMLIAFFDCDGMIYQYWLPKGQKHQLNLLLRGYLDLFEPSPLQEARKIWARLDTPPRQCQAASLQGDHGVLLQEEHPDLVPRTLQPGSCSMRLLAISPAENQTSRPTFWQRKGPQTGRAGGPRTALPRRPPSRIWTLDGENAKVDWCRGEYVEKQY